MKQWRVLRADTASISKNVAQFPPRRHFNASITQLLVALAFIVVAIQVAHSEKFTSGTVVVWGDNSVSQTNVPLGLTRVKSVAAGKFHTLALKTDGTVAAWGLNDDGQVSVPPGLTGVVAIAGGDYHSVALKADGTVVAWGSSLFGETAIPSDLRGIKSIAAGSFSTFMVKSDGTVLGLGKNGDYANKLSNVEAVAVGSARIVALEMDGTVVVGPDFRFPGGYGTLNFKGTTAITAAEGHVEVLDNGGDIHDWGCRTCSYPYFLPPVVPLCFSGDCVVGWTAIATSSSRDIGLRRDGTVFIWKADPDAPGVVDTAVPSGLGGVIAIAAGDSHAVAVIGTTPSAELPRGAVASVRILNGSVVEGSVIDFGAGYPAPPLVAITGGGGGGATATAVVVEGYVTGIQIDNPGSGYSSAPTVFVAPPPTGTPRKATATLQVVNGFVVGIDLVDAGWGYDAAPAIVISDLSGSGATAIASVSNGAVTAITVLKPGTGYSATTTIEIAAPQSPPRKATATPLVVNGFVVGINLIDGGSGYDSAPDVVLSDGFGSGASAIATISNGVVTDVRVIKPGKDYSSATTVIIAPPLSPPRKATATAQVVNGFVVGISVIDGGAGYDSAPEVVISDVSGSGATAFATVSNGEIGSITIIKPGFGYSSSPMVMVGSPPPSMPRKATASAQLVNGFVVGINIINGGAGYDSPPEITITDASGSGAAAAAILTDGVITAITILKPGIGYDPSTTVVIASPRVPLKLTIIAIPPTSSSDPYKVRIRSNLVLSATYRIEASGTLGAWEPWGEPFVAAQSQMFRDVDIADATRYFRLVEVP